MSAKNFLARHVSGFLSSYVMHLWRSRRNIKYWRKKATRKIFGKYKSLSLTKLTTDLVSVDLPRQRRDLMVASFRGTRMTRRMQEADERTKKAMTRCDWKRSYSLIAEMAPERSRAAFRWRLQGNDRNNEINSCDHKFSFFIKATWVIEQLKDECEGKREQRCREKGINLFIWKCISKESRRTRTQHFKHYSNDSV